MEILGGISALRAPIGTIFPRGFRFNQHHGAGMSLQAQIDQTFPNSLISQFPNRLTQSFQRRLYVCLCIANT